jgi:hypothetical protein
MVSLSALAMALRKPHKAVQRIQYPPCDPFLVSEGDISTPSATLISRPSPEEPLYTYSPKSAILSEALVAFVIVSPTLPPEATVDWRVLMELSESQMALVSAVAVPLKV